MLDRIAILTHSDKCEEGKTQIAEGTGQQESVKCDAQYIAKMGNREQTNMQILLRHKIQNRKILRTTSMRKDY